MINEQSSARFGKCAKCGGVSSCHFDEMNLKIIYTGEQDNYFPSYGYDLCDECIEYIIAWIEDKSDAVPCSLGDEE